METFYELLVQVDLNESEEQIAVRSITGLEPNIQDVLVVHILWSVFEPYNRALTVEKQQSQGVIGRDSTFEEVSKVVLGWTNPLLALLRLVLSPSSKSVDRSAPVKTQRTNGASGSQNSPKVVVLSSLSVENWVIGLWIVARLWATTRAKCFLLRKFWNKIAMVTFVFMTNHLMKRLEGIVVNK